MSDPTNPTNPSGPFETREVAIRDDSIKLGQFLKLANLVDSGADAKDLIAGGVVRVNGEPETRRGRQLRAGDEVSVGEQSATVATGASAGDDLPW